MPAAFQEIQFPTDISAGATGGPGFHTTVQTLASGFERRNVDWSRARAKYNVASGVKSPAQANALIKFFYARNGRAYGFRFRDPNDYKLPFYAATPGDLDALPLLFTTDGGVTFTFQIRKVYGDAGNSYTRPISKPVTGTVRLYDNTVLTNDYTCDFTTGVVTLGTALRATTGRAITGSCLFDVPVRFDIDDMAMTTHVETLLEWSNIPLVEVRV